MLLESILVSEDAERVLLFISARGQGYASEIADYYQRRIFGIQRQLDKFELGGLMISRKVGRTRLFEFNPRYPLLKELKLLLEKTISFLPSDEKQRLLVYRERPRRSGKPL